MKARKIKGFRAWGRLHTGLAEKLSTACAEENHRVYPQFPQVFHRLSSRCGDKAAAVCFKRGPLVQGKRGRSMRIPASGCLKPMGGAGGAAPFPPVTQKHGACPREGEAPCFRMQNVCQGKIVNDERGSLLQRGAGQFFIISGDGAVVIAAASVCSQALQYILHHGGQRQRGSELHACFQCVV